MSRQRWQKWLSSRPTTKHPSGNGQTINTTSPHEQILSADLDQRYIIRFWLPLLATWMLMASEGPVVAAMIARLGAPTTNLAAYGVALAFALILEAPIIMMMSAAITLVKDRASYLQLRRYAFVLNALVLTTALIFLVTPLFDLLVRQAMGLSADLAARVHQAVWMLLPWPVAIGFRRFYQGVMISTGATRQVTVGTVVRLSTMVATCMALASYKTWFSWLGLEQFSGADIDGATIGGAALAMGVSMEAVVARCLAGRAIKQVFAQDAASNPLTWHRFWHFYYPLAITSFLALAIQPLVTFFVGRARLPIESLAVLPVLNSISFIFRCFSLSMQDVVVAMAGKVAQAELATFVKRLAVSLCLVLAALVYSPFALLWLTKVTGLPDHLANLGIVPLRILVLAPVFSLLLSYLTALAIHGHNTKPVTLASILEVIVIATTLWLTVGPGGLSGVMAATISLATGRIVGAAYLFNARPQSQTTLTPQPI